ncbi:MAG TPA: DNA primase [Anaeromyxobacteraceae bacterium]
MIPDAVIDEVRGRIDIVAVIGRHMELKKSGRTWKGCCVFHGERTPSFHVYPEDRHFKCYGCGEYGDVFKFLQRLQGKEFPEVVRALALEAGVEIPEREEDSAEQRKRRQERTDILAACDAAARYFAARLGSPYGEQGRAYLASRGISDETLKLFRLGIASTAWDDLVKRLVEKGVSEASLENAGLVARRDEGKRYDRFRARLMFPIAGLDGEVIGFGGRVLPGASDKLAKYINSPESLLYKKSKVLYGIDLAREHIRKTRSAVLVEGYFDVIGLHQTGVRNAVAVCGTALTPEHVELLKRCDCREVTVLFDGDLAGLAAPGKAAHAILPAGISGKVALLPSGAGKTDPDEFARANGLAAVEALLGRAIPLTEFLIDRAISNVNAPERAGGTGGLHPPVSMEAKLAAFRELKPFLELAPAGLARTLFEERVAKRLDVSPAALVAEVEVAPEPARVAPRSPQAPAPRPARTAAAKGWGPAVDALGLLASFPQLGEVAREEHIFALFGEGPLTELVRELVAGTVSPQELPARLEGHLAPALIAHVRDMLGPARPPTDAAAGALRKAIMLARVSLLEQEYDRLNAAVARAGTPAPRDLVEEQITTWRRLADLKKRLDAVERG